MKITIVRTHQNLFPVKYHSYILFKLYIERLYRELHTIGCRWAAFNKDSGNYKNNQK